VGQEDWPRAQQGQALWPSIHQNVFQGKLTVILYYP
jgi:hypothetical protein